MMSKKKRKVKKHIDFEPSSTSLDSHSTRGSSVSSEIMNQRFSGQLSKYTNVVKGWQYRWFLLDPSTGMLHYYLSENESSGNPRAGVHLQGALICPSDEDSHTFTVNSSSGEVYKLRATDARARQDWVNRLRSVAEHHSSNLTKDCMGISLHSGVFVHGSHIHSPATTESFSSAKEHLSEAEQKYIKMCKTIEILPSQGFLTCVDPKLLTLKSYSQSLIVSLRECVDILQRTFAADCGFRPTPGVSESKQATVIILKYVWNVITALGELLFFNASFLSNMALRRIILEYWYNDAHMRAYSPNFTAFILITLCTLQYCGVWLRKVIDETSERISQCSQKNVETR